MPQEIGGLELNLASYHAGTMWYRKTGEALPQEVLNDCLAANPVADELEAEGETSN